MTWFWLTVGLTVLTAGAEVLVRGAVALAAAMRISPLVIGLTVVAFGTSAPELVVSLQSAFTGQGDIALGNVIGSNIFNVLVILGLSAIIVPLRVDGQLIRFDVPLVIVLSIVVYGMALDGRIDRLEGALLVAGLVTYTVWSIRKSRLENSVKVLGEFAAEYSEREASTPAKLVRDIVMIGAGLAMMVVGGNLFVGAAVEVARAWGFSELVIGLTIVAAGTSLPEAATSVVAALKGERDIAVGNVVGSNIFNLMCVLGVTSLVAPDGIPASGTAISQDLPIMVLVAMACLPVFLVGHAIERWEACFLLAFYVLYAGFLIAQAQGHTELLGLLTTIAWVLGPVAVAVYVVSLAMMWRHYARGR
jgi:cation:H+ antiporter